MMPNKNNENNVQNTINYDR